MATAATIAAQLTLNSDSYSKGLDAAEGRSSSFASKLGSLGAGVAKLGAAMAVAGAVAFTGFLVDSAKSAIQSENAIAELDAVLKSTEASMTKAAEATGHWGTVTKASGEHVADWEKQLKSAQNSLSNLQAKQAAGIGLTEAEQKRMGSLQAAVQSYSGALSGATTTATVWFSTQEQGAKISHLSREEYLNLASALQKVTKFSDEAVLGGESMLLTFTNIGKDIFPQATEAVLNMAEKFGSVDAASVQLGKALNDPIAGATALKKVGVSLTEQQEKQIKAFVKSGDILSAQKVILKELETEFGGLARAAGAKTEGTLIRFGNAIDDIKEKVGNALLPIMKGFLDNVLIPMTPKLEKAATFFSNFISSIGRGENPLKAFGFALQHIMLGLGFTGDQAMQAKDFFLGLGNSFEEISKKLPGVITWFQELGQAFLNLDVAKIGEMLGPVADTITAWISQQATALSTKIATEWGPAFTSWLQFDAPVIAEKLGAMVGSMTAWLLTDGVKLLMDTGRSLIGALFSGEGNATESGNKIAAAFRKGFGDSMAANKGAILASIAQVVLDAIATAQTIAAGFDIVGRFAIAQILLGIQSVAAGIALNVSLGMLNAIAAARAIAAGTVGIGLALIQGMVDGVKSAAGALVKAASDAVNGAITAAQSLLGISSPSKVFHAFGAFSMQGFGGGFIDNVGVAVRAVGTSMNRILNSVSPMALGGSMNMALAGGGAVGLNPAMAAVPSGGGSGGGITINGNIVLNDVGNKDPEQVADEFLQQVGRKFKQFKRSGATNLGAG